MPSAYATTQVAVERSQREIRNLLAGHDSTRFAFGEDRDMDGRRWAAVSFVHANHEVRMRVPLKLVNEREVQSRARRARTKTAEQIREELYEQEERRIWRVMIWTLKARMVAIDEGVETFEEAFLAHLVNTTTGRTIYEDLVEAGQVALPRPLLALPPGDDR